MNFPSTVMRIAGRRATPLASALALTLFTGVAASTSVTAYNPIANLPAALPKALSTNTLLASPVEGPAYYTVVFKEAPVATYGGEVSGLRAPDHVVREGVTTAKVDVNSAPALAYVNYLASKQQSFINELSGSFGRSVDVMARMQHALNAVIVRLSSAEASQVMKRPDVMFIEREHQLELSTDRGPAYIGATSIWNGVTATGISTKGEGVLFGDIDSGINWESPAFAAVGPIDGFVHQNPKGNGTYLGQCAPGGVDAGKCNDKLIGIYNFAAPGTTGTDIEGHGSHTASTVAGNQWNATYASGAFTISGVAPHANVISYLSCPTTSCPSTATAQSANQAVADGVDVINYSISGGTSPWTDATSTGFRNAVAAGAFVAASAGNTSTATPDPQGQVNHMEPWVETVAASTEDRIIAVSLDLTSEASPPANTQDIPMRPGAAPLPTVNLVDVPLIKSPNFANGATDGCAAYPANTFVRSGAPGDRIFADGFDTGSLPPVSTGAIAVLHLDGLTSACGSGARRTAALNAGAVGVIFVDTVYLNLGADNTSWSMLMSDWLNLETASTPATASVSIDIHASAFPGPGDEIASFSFRGPRLVSGQGMVKPDITGPGVDILAVGASSIVGPNGVILLNGTSMSSPHMAGAGALMHALNPTWSPTQIKSALNLSSNNFGAINQDGTPVRIWDYGSGRVNLSSAAKVGLTMDETSANFLAANPAIGGDISTLNLASLAKTDFVGDTTFTRTFRRARGGSRTYTLSSTGFAAGAIEFSPTSFTVNAGGSSTVTITAHGALLTSSQWNLGEMTLTPTAGDEPNLHLPIALNPAGPVIAVSPTAITASSDTTVSNDLTISNVGNPTLNWTVQTTGNPQVTPLNTTTSGSGQLGGYYLGASEGNYWFQNFDVAGTTSITTLRANGFLLPSGNLTTANTPSVTFSIYADNAGLPAGAPENFGAAPVWTYTNTIGTAATTGITGTGGTAQLVLSAPGVPPLSLPNGRHWLTVYPTMNGIGDQSPGNPLWAWRISSDPQIGNPPVIYAPYDDPTQFQSDPETLNMSAFVQGTVSCALPSWVNLTTTSGSLGFAGSQAIPVGFDATGLSAGTYSATLCISSNATNLPIVTVPLTFTVTGGGATTPTISKSFSPTSVAAGTPSTLTITLANPVATEATLTSALTDTFPTGLLVAPTPNATTTCASGTVTAVAGSGSVSLSSGAQIPASGNCTVSVDVRAVTAGTYANTIAAGALQTSAGTNVNAANASLDVTAAAFPAPYCPRNFTSDIEPITLVNLSGISNSSSNVVNSSPALENFLAVNGGTLVPGATYAITVKGNTAGNFTTPIRAYIDWNQDGVFAEDASERYEIGSITNSTGVDAKQTSAFITVPITATNGPTRMRVVKKFSTAGSACGGDDASGTSFGQAEDYTVTLDPSGTLPPPIPTVSKSFAPAIASGVALPTTLTINLGQLNAVGNATLTAALIDALPAGLTVAATPNDSTTCPSGTVTAAPAASTVSLAIGAQIPVTGCSVVVNLQAAAPGVYTNTIAAGALQTDLGNSPTAATATYRALAANQPNYSTGFESPFTVGGINGQQGWTGSNANAAVSAALPGAGLQHLRLTSAATAPSAGSPTQVVGTSAYSVMSAKVRLTRTTNGATFELNPQDPVAGVVSTLLRFDRGAARDIQIANFVTGLYEPTGAAWPLATYFDLRVVFDRAAGSVQVCVDGSSIYNGTNAVSSPYIGNVIARQIAQTGSTNGNTFDVDDLVIDNASSGGCSATPPLDPPTVTKAFAPASVDTGVSSTLTITLANTNATAATLTSALADTFPAGLLVAPTPNAATTCGGTVSAVAGSGSVSLSSGAQIPATGNCTVTVSVQSATAGSYPNSIPAGALQTGAGNNAASADATLTVTAPVPVCSAQQIMDPGLETTDADTFINALWASTSTQGDTAICNSDCGASNQRSGDWWAWFGGYTSGNETATLTQSVTIQPGFDRTLSFWLRRLSTTNTTATMTVSLDGNVIGTYPRVTTSEAAYVQRSIPLSSAVSDGNAHVVEFRFTKTGTGSTGSHFVDDVTLDCTDPGGLVAPTVTMGFAPTPVAANTPSTLTITLGNGNASAATLSAALVDTLPAGLVISPAPNASMTCASGTLTAAAGTDSITLSSGTQIPASGTCTVNVNVQAASEANYANAIALGALQTNVGSNDYPARAALYVGNPVFTSGPIHHLIPNDGDGLELDFETGVITDGYTGGIGDWNPYYVPSGFTYFWEFTGNAGVATTTTSTGKYVVLQSGATIGPSSVFNTNSGGCTGTGGNNSNFCVGVNGYLGFRFVGCSTSPSGTCYGYVHLTTTGTTGNPAYIEDYAYDKLGNAITIP